jgi:GT2 family glycosyltransferase
LRGENKFKKRGEKGGKKMTWLMTDDVQRDTALATELLETLRKYGEVTLPNGKVYKLEIQKTDDPLSPFFDSYVPSDEQPRKGRPVSFRPVLTVS